MATTEAYTKEDIDVNKLEKKENEVNFPYEIIKIEGISNDELLKDFKGNGALYVQIGPKKWCFSSGYEEEAAYYYNFEFRPDDVVVMAFPRSGSVWTEEMVWLLANNLDYETAKQKRLDERFPFLEYSSLVDRDVEKELLYNNRLDPVKCREIQKLNYPRWKLLSELQERRFTKTHLPFSVLTPNLLDVGSKVIYVARNPRDVAVSYYHLIKSRRKGYTGDFPTFWSYFERNLLPWTPYWEHIKEAWERRHNQNMLFLFYEDMNRNLRGPLEKIANFLGKTYTSEEYQNLEEHLKIENFKQNPSVNLQHVKELKGFTENNFVRVGKTGGWRSYFDDELNTRADEWIKKNIQDSDLEFPKDFFE